MFWTDPEGLLESAVVCDVLALSHPAVHIEINLIQLVPGVLINDALGSFPEGAYRRVIPPLHHVTILVKLPTCNSLILKKYLVLQAARY